MSPEKQRWHVGFVVRKWNWHRCIISIGAWNSSLGGVERLTAPSLSSLSIYLFYYFFLSLIKLVLQPYDSFIFCTWLFPIFKQLQSKSNSRTLRRVLHRKATIVYISSLFFIGLFKWPQWFRYPQAGEKTKATENWSAIVQSIIVKE